MKIAINLQHKDKMPRLLSGTEIKSWWRKFNGDFRNFDLPELSLLIKEIQNGHAYTTQHRGYRKADNFRCGQHVGLDFDTGDRRSSFEGILEDSFIKNNAYFLHTTASHTRKHPRARVVFVLEHPIYSVGKYSLLTESFAETYKTNGAADPSCKDPVRIFFGATGCTVLELGNILTLEKAAEIVLPYKDKLKQRQDLIAQHHCQINSHVDREFLIRNMISKIQAAPDGEKWYILGKVAREAGGYVGAGYFTESDVFNPLFQAIASRPSTRNLDTAKERLEWGISAGKTEPLYLEEDLDPLLQSMLT